MRVLAISISLAVVAGISAASFAKLASEHSAAFASTAGPGAAKPAPNGAAVPVIVELFTSEGCSSCPPADALLVKLQNEQPIPGAEVVALEEHVDYWNDLGWNDPFSSQEMTARQQRYAEAFGHGSSYTPQMVVDGQFEFVGSRASEARETIGAAAARPRAEVSVARSAGASGGRGDWTVNVRHLAGSTDDTREVWLAVTETRLHSNVESGENAGRDLGHAAVVRQLIKLGTADGRKDDAFSGSANVNFRPDWKRENLRVVAFVQERNSRHILGAGSAKVSE
ncbi:MAG: DUF1223 domain-containing protein [Candidatus Acidiferrum sp.]|jgi:hypothetical protein